MSVFVSVYCYALAKVAGSRLRAQRFIEEEIAAGEGAQWPCYRTLARLRDICDVTLVNDHSTLIAKARSVMAQTFLKSAEDKWVSIDDDVDAPRETLSALIEATRERRIVVVAQATEQKQLNVKLQTSARAFDTPAVFPIDFGGLSLSCCHRTAIARMADIFAELKFTDANGLEGVGLFLEEVRDGSWYGEDAAFFERAKLACVYRLALVDAPSTHRGMRFNLRDQLTRDQLVASEPTLIAADATTSPGGRKPLGPP